jgi:hypothetical protein
MILTTALVSAGAAAACSGGDASPAGDAGDRCFVAFAPQFDGFRSWTSYRYTSPTADDASSVHISGPRTEYIKQAPPHGSTAFPLATTIVKEVGADDPANHHIFAMVKRGCGFNPPVAGWEWMELTEVSGGATILWRGAAPPAGENYGGDNAGCDSCHGACSDNDRVCSPVIRLSNY